MAQMLTIDGSHQEGGGQIIRTAVALSALTGKAVKIEKIRAGRPNPGLQAQHLAAVEAAAKMCNAEVSGAKICSQALEFHPKEIVCEDVIVKISTAGSAGLVLQTLFLSAAAAKKPVKIRIGGGATFGKWAPPVGYMQMALLPVLEKLGFSAKISIVRHGFYPVGGAIVEAEILPAKFKKIEMETAGSITKIFGVSVASKHLEKQKVAERQRDAAISILGKCAKLSEIKTEYVDAACPGSGIVLCATGGNVILGADALGERGKSAESVGGEAAKKLLKQIESSACLDEWMADQILPYLALSGGAVKVAQITPHCETNIWVIEQFLGKRFEVERENKIIRITQT